MDDEFTGIIDDFDNPNSLGRPPKHFDLDAAIDLLDRGHNTKDVSAYVGVSVPTLKKRIREIQQKQGILLNYRAVQSLQLTELQAKLLEAVTPEKINEASLKDIIMCYKILKEKELVIEGKPSDIKGLLAHLVYLEKQEQGLEPELLEDMEGNPFIDIPVNVNEKQLELNLLSELDTEDF
ncbi:hypothetical protein KO465_04655 [Candidatus Micrarchaeota archaeon]|nr:hypothetical protein [Candidatus Micrarchaeota archaeon]